VGAIKERGQGVKQTNGKANLWWLAVDGVPVFNRAAQGMGLDCVVLPVLSVAQQKTWNRLEAASRRRKTINAAYKSFQGESQYPGWGDGPSKGKKLRPSELGNYHVTPPRQGRFSLKKTLTV